MANLKSSETASHRRVLTVSEITAQIKRTVETSFPSVSVAGEISNLSRPQSGHCYFTLKDDAAQLRAVVWRSTAARLKVALQDALEVICRGRMDVYPQRGSYQLVVERLEPQGVGALELALRQLRDRLGKEGLFDAEKKRPLPKFPRRIGVVTSPSGAAIRDFLEVLRRRWRGVEVLIVPTPVQGAGAAERIAAAVKLAERIAPPLEVLIITRGGGSLEDLWCFNEEPVVRAIAASNLPTISAVGHEIDVTLSDLAADLRALTPSEAAERVVPAANEVQATVDSLQARLQNAARGGVRVRRDRVAALASRPALERPLDAVRQLSRLADELSLRLDSAVRADRQRRQGDLAEAAAKLETLSPLAVLGRGYSLTQRERDGRLVTDATELRVGDRLVTRLDRGAATSTVDAIDKNP